MPSSRRIAEHRRGYVLVLQRQELGPPLHDRDPAAEAAEHLPELEPDVAAAEHEQVLGDAVQLHDRGRVERGEPVEAIDIRGGGPAPALMKIWSRLELPAVHRDRLRGPVKRASRRQIEALGGLEPALAAAAEALDDVALALAHPGHVHRAPGRSRRRSRCRAGRGRPRGRSRPWSWSGCSPR